MSISFWREQLQQLSLARLKPGSCNDMVTLFVLWILVCWFLTPAVVCSFDLKWVQCDSIDHSPVVYVIHRHDHKVVVMPKKMWCLPPSVVGLDWLKLWKTTQPFEKFISTIHKLYNTAHICLLWNSKSNRKFQFTNYFNWKKHYVLMKKKRKYNTISYHTNIVPQKSISQYKTSNTNREKINIIHKTSWANNVWYSN